MTEAQTSLDLGGRPTACAILDRIRSESCHEFEKGRWFEQLYMCIALEKLEFKTDEKIALSGFPFVHCIRLPRQGARRR